MTAKLPPINAALTEVRSPDSTDDYTGEVISEGEVRWSGDAPAYMTEKVIVETAQGNVDQLIVTRIVIPSTIEVRNGDLLTYAKNGESATRTVRNIEERSDYGFTRIYFHDA